MRSPRCFTLIWSLDLEVFPSLLYIQLFASVCLFSQCKLIRCFTALPGFLYCYNIENSPELNDVYARRLPKGSRGGFQAELTVTTFPRYGGGERQAVYRSPGG